MMNHDNLLCYEITSCIRKFYMRTFKKTTKTYLYLIRIYLRENLIIRNQIFIFMPPRQSISIIFCLQFKLRSDEPGREKHTASRFIHIT